MPCYIGGRMATRKARKRKLLPFVQAVGDGFRAWWIEAGKRRFGPVVATEREAHDAGIRQRAVLTGPKGRLTLADGIELVRAEARELSAATRRQIEERVVILRRAFEDSKWLDSFTAADVEWFVQRRLVKGDATINTIVGHDLRILSRIFRVAHRSGGLPEVVRFR